MNRPQQLETDSKVMHLLTTEQVAMFVDYFSNTSMPRKVSDPFWAVLTSLPSVEVKNLSKEVSGEVPEGSAQVNGNGKNPALDR